MKPLLLPLLAMGAMGCLNCHASPTWYRNTAVSPDGKSIAFTCRGDIFIVPSEGGEARRLTSGTAYDTSPVWSPDSKSIVFASDREGSMDLYAVEARGGIPRRLTTYSGTEKPLAFADETHVIYQSDEIASKESTRHPTRLTRTYVIDTATPGARPQLYLSMPVGAASFSTDGRMLYQDRKGLENIYRKHERSSGTSDIWLRDGRRFTKLTDFNGHDLNPVWKPDNSGFWYLSEQDGTLNVYSSDGAQPGVARRLTSFDRHPVRSLSASADGLLAFSWDGSVYTMREGEEPKRLEITLNADQYTSDLVKSHVNAAADNMAVSPDGTQVAFTLRGDVYVTDTKYKTTRRITDTPAQERCLSFSPDGRTLAYDSDRDGLWQLFTAEIKNPEEKSFAYASEIVEKPLYKGGKTAQQPVFSPDGKSVAFLEDRTALRVLDMKTKDVMTVLDGEFNYSYTDGDIPFTWSPDSRWLLINYIGTGGWNNSDIAAVRADGSQVIDLTESGYSDGNPKWTLGGKAVTYETSRFGMKSHGSWGNQSDIMLMALDAQAWDDFNATEEEATLRDEAEKQKEENKKERNKGSRTRKANDRGVCFSPDFDNRRHRMRRLTSRSSLLGDYILSPKADKIYYTSGATEGGSNLYVHDLRKDETKVLAKGVSGVLASDSKGETIFANGSSGMRSIDLASGEETPIEYDADYSRSRSAEREYIFDHMLRQVKDKFYTEDLHGTDWEYYGRHYRDLLPEITNNYDFEILLSEILGELNASHTGGRYSAPAASMPTGELGAFFDPSYTGEGLKVTETIAGGPLSAARAKVSPGDIITSIEGSPILPEADWYPLLEGRAGRNTRLEIKHPDGLTDTVSVKPLSRPQLNDLLYKRWVARNEAFVDSLSGGRVAYVHVQGMDGESFSTVYDRLLGRYRNAEAVVVDTRWNGGGWLHNDLAILLGGRHYVDFRPRGQYIGSEPWSQWYKPSVMLVNEGNYSDAHGSPYTYKTLGLGKLVGAPVPGTMTAVWWEQQIDPTMVFGIPQVANCGIDGKPLENVQLNPDIEVYNNPADEIHGHDAQLEAAVRELMQ